MRNERKIKTVETAVLKIICLNVISKTIKIWCCTDAKTFYYSKFEVYVRQEGQYQLDNKPAQIVKRWVENVSFFQRSITSDN